MQFLFLYDIIYDDLVKIYNCKDCIEERQKLLNFMQSLVVLEYNGVRWHDVHPLVVEFLKEQGRLS